MKVYESNEEYPYCHYKNGLKPWKDYPLLDRVSLIIAIIALIFAYTNG